MINSVSQTNNNTNTSTTTGNRRVQWPKELSRHASIKMNDYNQPSINNQINNSNSPTIRSTAKSLQDVGGSAELTAALEEHSRRNSIAEATTQRPNFTTTSETPFDYTPSEPNSRADSSDEGDAGVVMNEKMAEVRETMNVFVDQGETDGMPSVRKENGRTEGKKAWQLVRAMKSGTNGFMRLRKNAGFKSGLGLGITDPNTSNSNNVEEGDEISQKEGGFFSNLVNQRNSSISGEPDSMGFPSSSIGGTGVLSALMALQQQQSGGTSGGTSVATTPTSSEPPSRRNSTAESSEDEDEEEEERRKFTYKQREKRERRSAWNGAAEVGKTVAGGVLGGAGYALNGAIGGTSYAVEGFSHALGFGHKRSRSVEPSPKLNSSHQTRPSSNSRRSSPNTSNSGSPRIDSFPREGGLNQDGMLNQRKKKGFFGETVNQVKKIGDRLGLEIDSTLMRPSAARSSAGVFGGLMLSTVGFNAKYF